MKVNALPAVVLLVVVSVQASAFDYLNGTVVSVADGDTIRIADNGEVHRIRLYGIDSPETDQPFGPRATAFAYGLVYGETVTIKVKERDRYGRHVGEVLINGRSLNRELVRAGYAWWYVRYAKEDEDLKRLEEAARREGRGLWQDADPVPPWEWRRRRDEGR